MAGTIPPSCSSRAREELAQVGFDPVFGARPLKRAIQNAIMNPLAQQILARTVQKGGEIEVDWDGANFLFKSSGASGELP